MKFRHDVLRALPVITLVCCLLPAPARAQFTQQGPKLVGTGAPGIASQGWSVSLSGDGNTAIVGGPNDDNNAGAAWVYTRSGGVWTQQAKLVVTDEHPRGDEAGRSVSLSGDGDTAIVGGGDAAWVYTRSGGVWTQQAKLVGTGAVVPFDASQGWSVSLSGDGNTAIVGGPFDNLNAGAVWVFTRSGGVWTQQGPKLVGAGGAEGGGFGAGQGYSVSLSVDGNTAIVGGPLDKNSAGAAWVFTRSGGVWTQQGPKLVGTGAVGSGNQGSSVSLSGDGNTAIVGGPFDNPDNAGAAWVYTRSGGVWTQQGPKLVGAGAVGSGRQGFSVSLSGDGNTAIVGGYFDNNEVGAVWVYARSGGVWTQQGPKLVGAGAVGPYRGALQGFSASLSVDGNTAIVGGPFDNNQLGAAWVFAQPVFAGTPGKANCHGKSVSALARQFGGLNAAAADLGFASVQALQDAILAYCGG